jgi:hypothetical protein
MDLQSIKLPPVSKQFYDSILRTFPPLQSRDVKESTSMITIQRNAAQQEVVQYIEQSVRRNNSNSNKHNLWNRIKYAISYVLNK